MLRFAAALLIGHAALASGATPSSSPGTAVGNAVTAPNGQPPVVKSLATPKDPTRDAVLIDRAIRDGLTVQLELEGGEAMWMLMGKPAKWAEHAPAKNERFHIEVKVTDNATKTRLPYPEVVFTATNKDNGKTTKTVLPPMWGSSGLHYSENSPLIGDGIYAATVTVGVPSFARETKDKDLWSKPVITRFHSKLKGGLVVEVSEAAAAPN